MTTTQIEIERRAEEAPSGSTALEVIAGFPAAIETADQYRTVTESCRGLRQLLRGIDEWFEGTDAKPGPKVQAHKLWRTLCDKQALARAVPARGIAAGKALLDGFDERTRLAQEKARRKAQEERERVEREAQEEADRLEAQAQEERDKAARLEAEARQKKAEAEKLKSEKPGSVRDEKNRQKKIDAEEEDERDRLAAIAAATQAAEDLSAASDRARDAPRPATAFAAPVEQAPAVEGASKSEGWDFDISNPSKIKLAVIRDAMKMVAADKLKASFLGQHIRKLVAAHGEQAGAVVGEGALTIKRKTTRSFS